MALAGGDTLTTRFLITATGFLSQPHTPDIPGITSFAGKVVHTTAWDDSHDFAGRRVGLIGTGATAIQLIPELAKTVGDLTVYQRTAIWVAPKLDFGITPAVQRLFARIPLTQRALRWVTDNLLEFMTLTAVLNYRYFRRLSIHGMDVCKIHRFVSGPRQGAAAQADSGLRHRLQAAELVQRLLPQLHQTKRAPGDRRHRAGSSRMASSPTAGGRPLSTPWCWQPGSICGTPTSRPSRSSAARKESRKVVAGEQVSGLPGGVDSVLPQLPEPGQPVCILRALLLQHHGIPDAAHGPVVG